MPKNLDKEVIMGFLYFMLGFILGGNLGVIVMALFKVNKNDD